MPLLLDAERPVEDVCEDAPPDELHHQVAAMRAAAAKPAVPAALEPGDHRQELLKGSQDHRGERRPALSEIGEHAQPDPYRGADIGRRDYSTQPLGGWARLDPSSASMTAKGRRG